MPTPLPGVAGPTRIEQVGGWALGLLRQPKSRECDAGSHLWRLLNKKYNVALGVHLQRVRMCNRDRELVVWYGCCFGLICCTHYVFHIHIIRIKNMICCICICYLHEGAAYQFVRRGVCAGGTILLCNDKMDVCVCILQATFFLWRMTRCRSWLLRRKTNSAFAMWHSSRTSTREMINSICVSYIGVRRMCVESV